MQAFCFLAGWLAGSFLARKARVFEMGVDGS